jgi:tether containing UBX domain for GLUT4
MDKFPSDTTLWLVLRKFESSEGRNLNFTGRGVTEIANGAPGAGRVFYEMPILNVMGRELSTFGDLQKTLAQLGFNGGSVLIRLNFKKTEQPLEEAMAEIGQYFKEEAAAAAASSDVAKSEAAPVEGVDTLSSSEGKDVDMLSQDTTSQSGSQNLTPQSEPPEAPSNQPVPETSSPQQPVLGPNERPIQIYSAPSSDTPRAALVPHDEMDYEPSIAHAKQHQALLQNNAQNKRLLSDAEIERLENERAAKLATTKQVTLKIRFPDQSSVVSTFTADDTPAQLYDYVTSLIAAENQPFKLVYNEGKGPQAVPRDGTKKLIKDLGFRGQILVNFLWEDGASESARKDPVLKSQYAQKAKAVPIPEPAVADGPEEETEPSVDKGKGKETTGTGGEGKSKGMPKWFKLGKK